MATEGDAPIHPDRIWAMRAMLHPWPVCSGRWWWFLQTRCGRWVVAMWLQVYGALEGWAPLENAEVRGGGGINCADEEWLTR